MQKKPKYNDAEIKAAYEWIMGGLKGEFRAMFVVNRFEKALANMYPPQDVGLDPPSFTDSPREPTPRPVEEEVAVQTEIFQEEAGVGTPREELRPSEEPIVNIYANLDLKA